MAEFLGLVSALQNREGAEARGAGVAGDGVAVYTGVDLQLGADPTDPAGPNLAIVLPLQGVEIVEAVIRPRYVAPDPSGSQPVEFRTFGSGGVREEWYGAGSLSGIMLDNGSQRTWDDFPLLDTGVGNAKIRSTFPLVRLAGAALGALGTSTVPTTADVKVTYREAFASRESGDMRGVVIATDATPIGDQLQALMETLRRGGQGVSLGRTSGGSEIRVPQCSYASMDTLGRVYVTSSDIGNANEQVPTVITQNSGAHYKFHPSAFFRRKTSGNIYRLNLLGIPRQPNGGPQIPITQEGGQAEILEVIRAPTHSTWELVIDGQAQIVTLAHPAGSDIRRPRDIYEQVVIPAVGAARLENGLAIFSREGSTYPQSGVLSSLEYLQYARYLFASDDQAASIYAPVIQTLA